MLDSLVRVSRRVGWITDGQPPILCAARGHPTDNQHGDGEHCEQSPPPDAPKGHGPDAADSFLTPPTGPHPPPITPTEAGHLAAGHMTADEAIVALSQGKCTHPSHSAARPVREDPRRTEADMGTR